MQTRVQPSLATRCAFAATRSLCTCTAPARFRVGFNDLQYHRRFSISVEVNTLASRRHFRSRRCATQYRGLATTQTAVSSLPEQAQVHEYSFTAKPKSPEPSSKSQIRQSLRAWSGQNERVKQSQVSDALPYEGKISRLPNSLFVDDEPKDNEMEEIKSLADGDLEEEVAHVSGGALAPGSLISHRSHNVDRQNVVYLGDIGTQSLLLLSDGRWAAEKMLQKRSTISVFRHVDVPEFLTSEEVEALRAYMPRRDVTRAIEGARAPAIVSVVGSLPDDVVAKFLPKLKMFSMEEKRFIQDHKFQLEQMYSTLALDDDWRVINIKDLPRLILGIEYEEMTYAAKKAFVRYATECHPLIVGAQAANTVRCHIGPKSLDQALKAVQEWSRLYQEAAAQASVGKSVSDMLRNNPLTAFIEKARRIIVKSRKIRMPTNKGELGPALDPPEDGIARREVVREEFTEDDKKIISYLQDTTFRRPISRTPLAHASLIVRAIGAYPDMELNSSTMRMLLKELGCLDPWATLEDISLPLPHGRATTELDKLHKEAYLSIEPNLANDYNCTNLPDSMAHLRKDWGQLKVFCIDATHTLNVEDGISVEPASELENGYWIRTHISHPTAHFEPDHPLAKYARKRGSAYYGIGTKDRHQPMLPEQVLSQFTLKNGSPCLTISTLLTLDGCVHDIDVQAGIVHNIQKVDRQALGEAFGENQNDTLLVVGKGRDVARSTTSDGPGREDLLGQETESIAEHLPQLRLLQELLSARLEQRLHEVAMPAKIPRLSISPPVVRVHLPESEVYKREHKSYHWRGDPDITVRGVQKFNMKMTRDQCRTNDVIAQAMRLASESTGKWLADRQVPAVFLGNEPPAGFSLQELNEKGKTQETERIRYVRKSRPTILLDQNMKQYTGCTSPNRKFIDMFNHFQVDSYLKAEAKGLVPPNAPVLDDSILAFTRSDVEKYIDEDVAASELLDDHSREKRVFWICQALFRAFYFKQAALPERMEVFVRVPSRYNMQGELEVGLAEIIPWGIIAQFEPSPEGYENLAKIHDFLPVKLVSVDPGRRCVGVRAVGPPTAEQQILTPVPAITSK